MRSLADYWNDWADLFAWWALWLEVQYLRWMIAANGMERAATTSKEVRTYLTAQIASHQATLDRLYINNLPLIERRLKGKTA